MNAGLLEQDRGQGQAWDNDRVPDTLLHWRAGVTSYVDQVMIETEDRPDLLPGEVLLEMLLRPITVDDLRLLSETAKSASFNWPATLGCQVRFLMERLF